MNDVEATVKFGYDGKTGKVPILIVEGDISSEKLEFIKQWLDDWIKYHHAKDIEHEDVR